MVASAIAKARTLHNNIRMRVIEELKRSFELFPLLDCVQSRPSFPWHGRGQIREHKPD